MARFLLTIHHGKGFPPTVQVEGEQITFEMMAALENAMEEAAKQLILMDNRDPWGRKRQQIICLVTLLEPGKDTSKKSEETPGKYPPLTQSAFDSFPGCKNASVESGTAKDGQEQGEK